MYRALVELTHIMFPMTNYVNQEQNHQLYLQSRYQPLTSPHQNDSPLPSSSSNQLVKPLRISNLSAFHLIPTHSKITSKVMTRKNSLINSRQRITSTKQAKSINVTPFKTLQQMIMKNRDTKMGLILKSKSLSSEVQKKQSEFFIIKEISLSNEKKPIESKTRNSTSVLNILQHIKTNQHTHQETNLATQFNCNTCNINLFQPKDSESVVIAKQMLQKHSIFLHSKRKKQIASKFASRKHSISNTSNSLLLETPNKIALFQDEKKELISQILKIKNQMTPKKNIKVANQRSDKQFELLTKTSTKLLLRTEKQSNLNCTLHWFKIHLPPRPFTAISKDSRLKEEKYVDKDRVIKKKEIEESKRGEREVRAVKEMKEVKGEVFRLERWEGKWEGEHCFES